METLMLNLNDMLENFTLNLDDVLENVMMNVDESYSDRGKRLKNNMRLDYYLIMAYHISYLAHFSILISVMAYLIWYCLISYHLSVY